MAMFHVGSVRTLQDCLVSVPIKCMSQNFYPDELRSGQFHDLPIISLLGIIKMPPVLHKPTDTTQFFQDHGHSPHLWWPRCNWWLWVMGRPPEVIWGQNLVFANNSLQDRDRGAQMVPNDLAHEAVRKVCILTYFGHDLTLTWPDPRTNFEIDL